jgi:mono/diheme cytochrome c family protein
MCSAIVNNDRATANATRSNVAALLIVLIATPVYADDAVVDYLRDVQPILRAHCTDCHGPDDQNGGLRLDTAALAISGGNSGTAIVPGDVDKSLLILAITGAEKVLRMPPEDSADKLPDDKIAILRRWIKEGAAHPDDEQPIAASNDGPKSKHWSFQPIVRREPPTTKNAAWPRTPIDAFVLAKLEANSITPAAEADRVTLIRRVSFDLTGLPPSIAEVDEFVNDTSLDAYERLVDRLLASPHYGERWGRWWLDQARYADSQGYSNDAARVMWKYRDWVIEAFNRDLPFDQFTIEQMAGDLLPSATLAQRVATGFHRNTQTYSEGASAIEEYRVESVVDRVSTTGVVFLGLTLGCARCHDHKFDPISQRDFYQLFAFFNSQSEEGKEDDEPKLEVPVEGWEPLAANGEKPPVTTALVMAERVEPRNTHIHIRGDFLSPGRQVFPAVPAVLPPLKVHTKTPSRLDLAQWLVSSENPLTSRVIVNRVWQLFFGKGIVETDDDFGTQGEKPTHPELLDWLATEFRQSGWSMKKLHRLLVTSAVYRQSSHVRSELQSIDPRNQLLARQNRLRLDAELVRDAALSASGLLAAKIGGPSVFPPQPDGVMQLTQHANRDWKASSGADRYRRGMYTFFWRLSPHPFLMAFNAPESNTTCTRRPRANTPLQSLMLLNDETFIETAQALAVRVLREAASLDDAHRIEYAVRLCLGRKPTSAELPILLDLLSRDQREAAGADQQRRFASATTLPDGVTPSMLLAWTTVARTILNLDEFITRE